MTEKQIAAREKELQSYLRIHPRLNLEFKALISRLFREHSIDVTPEILSRLTLALDSTGADPDPKEEPLPKRNQVEVKSTKEDPPPASEEQAKPSEGPEEKLAKEPQPEENPE